MKNICTSWWFYLGHDIAVIAVNGHNETMCRRCGMTLAEIRGENVAMESNKSGAKCKT